MIIEYFGLKNRTLQSISQFPKEKEVLIQAGARFTVKEVRIVGSQTVVSLKAQ